MSDFVHLHVHSHYSLLDGLSKIKELVTTAKKRGFSAIALTDHGNMYGAMEFYQECLKQEIKPIIGCEAYLAPGSRFDKDPKNRYHHLILLAENYDGYRNLMKLVSLAYIEGFYYKPRIDKELLRQYSKNIIASSACFGGEIAKIIRKENNFAKAKKIALEYEEIFGKGNFYLEMMDLPALEGQTDLNEELAKISRETGIPLIVTRDVHYLNPEDSEAQDILTCIRDGRSIEEPNRMTMMGVDFSLAKGEEIEKRFKKYPEAIANTKKIADRVNIEIELNKWHFPPIDIPEGKTADNYLREQAYEMILDKMELNEEVKTRLDYELGIILGKGYSPYFLAVADYVKYAKDNGIVETTRGSAAGSLVSYAIGITTVDPIRFKLPFERFLNPYRPSPPDVDTDFADDRRQEMIEYVSKKYGKDKVAQIITFGTMMARGAIRDVGRALGYSYSFCDHVAKLIPMGAQGFNMTLAKAIDLEPDLKKMYKEDPQATRLLDLAQKIEGCARHTSIHAAGVVISPTPLTDFMPVQLDQEKNKLVTQYEFHSSETAGVLKMDFLGIRNLSILGHAVEIVKKTTGDEIDVYALPFDDKNTYEMLARGETMGVFQLSSSGMTRYLKELKPTNINDIMAMVALFRPGPMDSIPQYIARKYGHEKVEFLDPRLEEILDTSYGLLVYQDDVMLTAIKLAGYDWMEADKFRKAMGKKIPEEMAKQKIKFYQGCRDFGGLKDNTIDQLWTAIEPFAAYGFNKAHAASYGIVAYQTAYMKANYPVQYMTAVLIAESGDMDKVPAIIYECERMGVNVLPPDVNGSFKNFAMTPSEPDMKLGRLSLEEKSVIRFGLNGIKNVGQNISEVIYQERKANGVYKDLEDFLTRVADKDLNKKSVESLIKCGAMDCFGYDRGVLLSNSENILNFVVHNREQKNSIQDSLFAGTNIDLSSKVRIEPAEDASLDDKLLWEKELLGFYITAHPFANYSKILEKALTNTKDLEEFDRNSWVVVGGIIDKAKKKITRRGKAMMFVTLQDLTGNLELLVFPKTYEITKDIWEEGKMVCVIGKTSEEEGDDKMFVEKAYEITKENVNTIALRLNMDQELEKKNKKTQFVTSGVSLKNSRIEIYLSAEEMKKKADDLKKIFVKYPGDCPVYLKVQDKTIKTSYEINKNSDVLSELSVKVGDDKLFVME